MPAEPLVTHIQRSVSEHAPVADHGAELADNAFELELDRYGWRVVAEKQIREAISLEIEWPSNVTSQFLGI